jgi:phosphate starvation-inducible protein PhoH
LDIENNLIQLSSENSLSSESTIKNKNKAQWGFLKNIVNIDTFFASGPGGSKSSKAGETGAFASKK